MDNDLISREALLHEVGKLSLDWEYGQGVIDCVRMIEAAPGIGDRSDEVLSLQSTINKLTKAIAEGERPKGEWTQEGYCSVCKCDMPIFMEDWNYKECKTDFCPNCGAKMKGGAE